jgi:hypothetical protein
LIWRGVHTTLAISNFYEDSDEISETIVDELKEYISKTGLSGKVVSCQLLG